MDTIGLDLHKRESQLCILTSDAAPSWLCDGEAIWLKTGSQLQCGANLRVDVVCPPLTRRLLRRGSRRIGIPDSPHKGIPFTI